MLVVLYVISALSGVVSLIFDNQEKFKEKFICTFIAIVTSLAFCILMIRNIINSSAMEFWSLFSVFSIIAWQFAFLRNDAENVINYLFCFFLMCIVFSIFEYSFTYSNYVVSCSENHVSTEIVQIVTTIDGTEKGKNIYGDGFVVGLVNDPAANKSIYQYYYRSENGTIIAKEIDVKSTTIVYVENTVSPYVEITSTAECFGYTAETKRHIFIGTRESYILYIPKGSIQNVPLSYSD